MLSKVGNTPAGADAYLTFYFCVTEDADTSWFMHI